jgi:hypothetical protein
MIVLLAIAFFGLLLWGIFQAVRTREPGYFELDEQLETIIDEYGNVHEYYSYTDENGVRHRREGTYAIDEKPFFEDVTYPVLEAQGFITAREIRIGQSDLYFFVNVELDRFAIGIAEYADTVRIYASSKIRRYEVIDDSGGNDGMVSVMLIIYMDDLYEPNIRVPILIKQNAAGSYEHEEAMASALEIESVLEYISDKASTL